MKLASSDGPLILDKEERTDEVAKFLHANSSWPEHYIPTVEIFGEVMAAGMWVGNIGDNLVSKPF